MLNNVKPKHTRPTEKECMEGKCCRCLSCKHDCVLVKTKTPSLTTEEFAIGRYGYRAIGMTTATISPNSSPLD